MTLQQIALFCGILTLHQFQFVVSSSSNPYIFEPDNVTDIYGNYANSDSNITWGPLPRGDPYKTSTDYDDAGLDPWFNFAKSFIDTVQPNDIPTDLINKAADGTLDIGEDRSEIINYAIGFAVCFAIGLLFVLIMPIVGCCFCCCRLCGNCGGRMEQKHDRHRRTKCIVFTIVLSVLTLFMGVGVICTYVTNDRMTDTLNNYETTIDTNLDDMTSYLNNTVEQLNHTGINNYDFTVSVIYRDLDNIGYLVGDPVKNELYTTGGVGAALDSILDMDQVIDQVYTDMKNVDDSVTSLKAEQVTLTSDLDDVQATIVDAQGEGGCTTACSSLDPTVLAMDVDFNALPNISSNMADIESAKAANLTANVIEGSREFEQIPEQVQNDTQPQVDDVKQLLSDFRKEIVEQIDQVASLPSDVEEDISKLQEDMKELFEPLPKYNDYRWRAGIGLTCTILLIVILQALGMIFGCIGSSSKAAPTDRGCLSNSGGNMLIAATAFIFIFSWLLMLLTSFSFIIGGNMEKVICEPLTDPDHELMKELLDGPGGLLADDNEYFLGDILLGDPSINLTFSGVLDACEVNTAAYSALKLSALFDLDTITNYQDSIDLASEINSINVDLSTVTILSADMTNQLNDLKSAVGIDYNGFKTELSKDTTQTDLTTYAATIRAAASSSTGAAKTKLNKAADDLDVVASGSYLTVDNGKTQLYNDIVALKTSTSSVPTDVDDVIAAAQTAEDYIQTNGSGLISAEASNYADRVLGVADQFSANVADSVENDVGGCQPVWNLWESMLNIAICKYTVDTLNGFWFGLGWSIFFMVPSLIFNVKLAKHFRRMNTIDEMDKLKPTTAGVPPAPSNLYDIGKSPSFASNKVAPA